MLLDAITAATFRTLSRLRGARIFHPDGVAFDATWHGGVSAGASALLPPGTHPAIARFSRGVGLPKPVPDILGVAVRIFDVHGPGHDQDLLFASVAGDRLGRRVLAPARDFAGLTLSTLLPYATPVGRDPVTARIDAPAPVTLATLEGDAPPHFEIRVSLGSHPAFARVRLGRRLPSAAEAALRFDPWHSGDGLRPAGFLNALRRPAYQASQQGRGAPAAGAHGPPPGA